MGADKKTAARIWKNVRVQFSAAWGDGSPWLQSDLFAFQKKGVTDTGWAEKG